MLNLLLVLTILLTPQAFAQSEGFSKSAVEPIIYNQTDLKDRKLVIKIDSTQSQNDASNMNVSDWIALGALVFSIGSIFYTHYLNSKTRKASIHDEFWMREVIYPNCMTSLLEFIRKAPAEYRVANNDVDLFWADFALDEVNKIRDGFVFLSAIDENLPEAAERILDGLEDNLDNIVDSSTLKTALATLSSNLIDLLKKAQEKV
ncbi:hypothetical protein [Vibrio atlanticus]|uniref:hypothetical protein n=1 Tax=Vibrio atlanticus TaxID=693153 RepID=UPI003D0B0B07